MEQQRSNNGDVPSRPEKDYLGAFSAGQRLPENISQHPVMLQLSRDAGMGSRREGGASGGTVPSVVAEKIEKSGDKAAPSEIGMDQAADSSSSTANVQESPEAMFRQPSQHGDSTSATSGAEQDSHSSAQTRKRSSDYDISSEAPAAVRAHTEKTPTDSPNLPPKDDTSKPGASSTFSTRPASSSPEEKPQTPHQQSTPAPLPGPSSVLPFPPQGTTPGGGGGAAEKIVSRGTGAGPVIAASTPTANGSSPNLEVITSSSGSTFVDITPFLNLPQTEAAIRIGIPPSTLSKRWKEAGTGRKWPWRTVCKIDKEIMTLLHNVVPGEDVPPDLESRLHFLMRKRQQELRPVTIRLK